MTANAVLKEGVLEVVEQVLVSSDEASIKQRGLGLVVFISKLAGLFDGSNRIAHVESQIEEHEGHLVDGFQNAFVEIAARIGDKKLKVNVASGVEMAAAVASAGDKSNRVLFPGFLDSSGLFQAVMKDIVYEDVHQRRATDAHFDSAHAVAMSILDIVSDKLEKIAI